MIFDFIVIKTFYLIMIYVFFLMVGFNTLPDLTNRFKTLAITTLYLALLVPSLVLLNHVNINENTKEKRYMEYISKTINFQDLIQFDKYKLNDIKLRKIATIKRFEKHDYEFIKKLHIEIVKDKQITYLEYFLLMDEIENLSSDKLYKEIVSK